MGVVAGAVVPRLGPSLRRGPRTPVPGCDAAPRIRRQIDFATRPTQPEFACRRARRMILVESSITAGGRLDRRIEVPAGRAGQATGWNPSARTSLVMLPRSSADSVWIDDPSSKVVVDPGDRPERQTPTRCDPSDPRIRRWEAVLYCSVTTPAVDESRSDVPKSRTGPARSSFRRFPRSPTSSCSIRRPDIERCVLDGRAKPARHSEDRRRRRRRSASHAR